MNNKGMGLETMKELLKICYKIFLFWPAKIIFLIIFCFIAYSWLAVRYLCGRSKGRMDDLVDPLCIVIMPIIDFVFLFISGGILVENHIIPLWAPIAYFLCRLFSYLVPLAYYKTKKRVNTSTVPKPTPSVPLNIPKDLYEYGKDVELTEKKEEPKIINPWQKRVTAGGE